MIDRVHDARVRSAAFDWLSESVAVHGDVLPRGVLVKGFVFDGIRVPLVGPQGIFKPQVLREVPLSITTSPNSPYDDSFGPNGLLRYRYRGQNPDHPDNRGLRAAMKEHLPLIYLHGVATGRYMAAWPVFIVGDDPTGLAFAVAVDDPDRLNTFQQQSYEYVMSDDVSSARREYVTSLARIRLHQRAFRERVLEAYHRQCAFCRLRHEELLDAAHIIPDSEPKGEPVVSNGLALCNLHHAAFDKYFLGIRPDYTIEVRPDILAESDGPTLRHAIQGLHGSQILLPAKAALKPDPQLIQVRYERFRQSMRSA